MAQKNIKNEEMTQRPINKLPKLNNLNNYYFCNNNNSHNRNHKDLSKN